MNTHFHPTPTPTKTAADSIDLMPYVHGVIDARWWLLCAGIGLGLLMGLWSLNKPYLYESTAKVSIVDINDPGGVSPDDRRASEVLTLVEHGFVMGTQKDNYNDVMLARLRSRDFTVRFIEEHNIYANFYPDQWDAESQAWRDDFKPDRGEVLTRFREQVRRIDHDELTDIISVSMQWPDAEVARDWANAYVRSFNAFMRERTLRDVKNKLDFLEKELRRSDVLEIQQSIYRLIEAQTAIAMLADAREEYVLEIIDPAALAYRSFVMPRKKKVVIGVVAGILLATFAVFAKILIVGLVRALIEHRKLYRAAHSDGA